MVAPAHLKSLQALELAMRTGSLKSAGEALAITPAAVGQRIKALEDYLGIELLDRGRAGMRPRDELSAVLPHLHSAFAAIEAAAHELDLQRSHELHIAAASDVVNLWLAPRLASFREAHPNYRLCINGQGDMPMRFGPADCEIRFGPARDDGLVDLLFHDIALPIGSAANLERVMRRPADGRLEGFPLLHVDFYKDDPADISWSHWFAANDQVRTAPERGIRFQRVGAALDAVVADAGISLCGLALITDLIADGRVKMCYPAATGLQAAHVFSARYRPDTSNRPHVRQFRTWVLEQAQRTAEALQEIISRDADRAVAPGSDAGG